ncbi:hypothetical protein C8R45DRAFT_1132286 [Mycena sanguinolenta]|nr:hypothetical protein C8R45DRAFT_1132286 [Mycena sanguinolenta]
MADDNEEDSGGGQWMAWCAGAGNRERGEGMDRVRDGKGRGASKQIRHFGNSRDIIHAHVLMACTVQTHNITTAVGNYSEVHSFQLQKPLAPEEVLCTAMVVSRTWETYWLHKQNCYFFSAAVVEALCRRAAYTEPNVPTLEPLNCDVTHPPAAPDIAFRIFRQPFSRQTSALIREESNRRIRLFHSELRDRIQVLREPSTNLAMSISSNEDNAPDNSEAELADSEEQKQRWRDEIDASWGRATRQWSLYRFV